MNTIKDENVVNKNNADIKIEDILIELSPLICPTTIDSQLSFSNQITNILSKIGTLINCEVGSISVISPKTGKLEGLTTFGYKADISEITYSLGKQLDGKDLFRSNANETGGGITAFVATVGREEWFNSQEDVRNHPAWAGKIDKTQWEENRVFKNCGIIPLIVGNETIGVLKMENFEEKTISKPVKKTIHALTPFIAQALDSYRKQLMPGEIQFRITQIKAKKLEKVELGDVLLEHLLTSICTSDSYYFLHKKSKEKLAERLPLVLGHETVAIIREVGLGKYYSWSPYKKNKKSDMITVGDHVVVIPQIPCGECDTCKNSDGTIETYGENYCENVKHMASNVDGSLRTKYRYQPNLLIKYNPLDLPNKLAVLTEPFAQLVQVLRELGFKKGENGFNLKLGQFNEIILNNAFNIPQQKFDSYFRIFASDIQKPRTLLRLPSAKELLNKSLLDTNNDFNLSFSHYALMRRGLFLSALQNENIIKNENPNILILGTGPSAFIAALLLREAYNLRKDQVYIYGRRDESLKHFSEHNLGNTINVGAGKIDGNSITIDLPLLEKAETPEKRILTLQQFITNHLKKQNIKFDLVLECAGGDSTENLISFALDNIANKGIIALFGLSDQPITVNFKKVMESEITFKGFFRACLGSYFEAIEYLKETEFAQKASELLQDREPNFIKESCELDAAFEQSLSKKENDWGKILVKLADTIKPITRK
jgi:Threonine dehydrogenase and related Zn-dependent dehydrogenases